ncbi:hypothetical protein AB0K51_34005 [Kitasatospora sp. NPDC049285]|uniref:hypothetical protein n=1 Tax=Kitasatospora sp. NPDC049285 TaxID=3157096 RepID=UPI003422EA7F
MTRRHLSVLLLSPLTALALAACGSAVGAGSDGTRAEPTARASASGIPAAGLAAGYGLQVPAGAEQAVYAEDRDIGSSAFWVSFRTDAKGLGAFLSGLGRNEADLGSPDFALSTAAVRDAGWQFPKPESLRGLVVPGVDSDPHAPTRSVLVDLTDPSTPVVYGASLKV